MSDRDELAAIIEGADPARVSEHDLADRILAAGWRPAQPSQAQQAGATPWEEAPEATLFVSQPLAEMMATPQQAGVTEVMVEAAAAAMWKSQCEDWNVQDAEVRDETRRVARAALAAALSAQQEEGE